MGALKLRLPGFQLAIHGRRTNRGTFGQEQCFRAQDEWLGLPAAEAAMRTDEFLKSGDLLRYRVDRARRIKSPTLGKPST